MLVLWAVSYGLAPAPAHAKDADADRWLPAAAFEMGLQAYKTEADAVTSDLIQPADPGPVPPGDPNLPPFFFQGPLNGPLVVQDPIRGSEVQVTPVVGMDFELMTPQLYDRWGKPRLFIDVNLSAFIGNEDDVAKRGTPGELRFPDENDLPGNFQNLGVREIVVVGQGLTVSSVFEPFTFSAGLGVAFQFDVGDYRMRLKPSIVYSQTEVKVSGVLGRAVQQRANMLQTIDAYRLISFADNATDVMHGVGPAVELEFDTGRFGSFMTSVFLKSYLEIFVSDRETELFRDNFYGESVSWRHEYDRLAFRASTGIRIRWNPE